MRQSLARGLPLLFGSKQFQETAILRFGNFNKFSLFAVWQSFCYLVYYEQRHAERIIEDCPEKLRG
jgi:hypothetical protein